MTLRLAAVFILISSVGYSQTPLWGDLRPGAHGVGYDIIEAYDYSRAPIDEQNLQGIVTEKHTSEPGRQIRIAVWYPSTSKKPQMTYEDYILDLTREISFGTSVGTKDKAYDKMIALYHDHNNTTFDKSQLEKLSKIPVASVKKGKASQGKFPVLIFPHWYCPVEGSIMAEYLASNGFVVAGISMRGTDSTLPEISSRGLQAMGDDIRFTINKLSSLPFADVTKVSTMGVGFNASTCVTAMKDVSSIDSFISLDGGIITGSEMPMFQQTGRVDPANFAKPMLFIHAPHPAVNPNISDFFRYADRYIFKFPGMSEFHFLNAGQIESVIPNIIGTPPGDVKKGYETAAVYVLHFLRATLNNDPASKKFIENEPTDNGLTTAVVERSFRKGLPAPPSLYDLRVLCVKEKGAGLRSTYEQLKSQDPQPFSIAVLADLFSWLGLQRDDDFAIRTEVAKIWIESHPTSSRGQYTMARVLTILRKSDEAKPYYQKALELLPDDTDIYLDNITRVRINTVSRNEVKK